MIRADGTFDRWQYGYQPTTNDIAKCASRHQTLRRGQQRIQSTYTHCVQKIGNVYEVYDLKTLKRLGPIGYPDYTIGLPVATHHDFDAAVMMAVLSD
jgi:hypothetical protein